jgi:two-component system, NarL family, sensor kinase
MTLVGVDDDSMADKQALTSNTEQLRRRNRELSILNAIAQALNREVELTQALHTALAQVTELLGLHTGWIWLLSEETGQSYLAAAQNLPPRLMNTPRLMEGDCYCLRTYREGDLEGLTALRACAITPASHCTAPVIGTWASSMLPAPTGESCHPRICACCTL